MHVIVCSIAGCRFALDTEYVVEVIPQVPTRPLPRSQPWNLGLLNHRGSLIPLVDMSILLGSPPCRQRLASRVLVIGLELPGPRGQRHVGLLVEEVSGVGHVDFDAGPDDDPRFGAARDVLGPVALTEQGPLQLILPDRILPDLQRNDDLDLQHGQLPQSALGEGETDWSGIQ